MQDRQRDVFRGQQFGHAGTRAAHHHVVFECHETIVRFGQIQDQRAVERFDKTHVDHGQAEFLADLVGGRHQRAKGEQGDARAAATQLGLADRQCVEVCLHRHAGTGAARIAHGGRALELETGAEHLPAFVLVRRRHHQHVRHATQVRQIEAAGVGGTVRANHAAAVDRKQHVEVLHRDIVHQLVIAALQERRVDRDHRFRAFAGHAGGERHRMLLGDGDIEIALGILLAEAHQARAFAHRRRDRQQLRIVCGHVAQPVAEHVGVGRFLAAGLADQAFIRIERRHRVVADLVAFGQLVAFAFGGDDVQQLRALQRLQRPQCLHQCGDVVAVDRAGVVEAHLLEQGGRHEHAFPVFFPAAHEFRGRLVLVAEQLLAAFA